MQKAEREMVWATIWSFIFGVFGLLIMAAIAGPILYILWILIFEGPPQ